jgi:broad-specificity NMP kinase
MTQLQAIEQALSSINESKFQELGDAFIHSEYKTHTFFSRIGSALGKEKTIKGTPDCLIQLNNGKFLLAQYSTNVTSGIKKMEEDIKKCLDEKLTHIPVSNIEKIIIILNFNPNSEIGQKVIGTLANFQIEYKIYTNSDFALDLLDRHRNLISDYLEISFDSGQIVPIDTFIYEYNKASSGIATPLDNTFLHREQETKKIINALGNNDFIILTGTPGVGKTKLALESINQFLQSEQSFTAYCISYKSYDFFKDMELYMDKEKNYIIFVDDANRVDYFNQIIGYYRTIRNGQLKIICTVRNYALKEIEVLCNSYLYVIIEINKFTDDQIKDIIKAEPFKILNPEFQDKIISIADGNPRIAIMTSRLAIAKQDIYSLSNVSELFDCYFNTYIKDKNDLDNPFYLKCLALIAFFPAIPYNDREITDSILRKFDINYSEFIDCIDKLEKLEIVEKKYGFVKISDQNLSFFFFFKSFIKDEYLSFYILLENYFETKLSRFKDCVISSNNMFGYEIVSGKLTPHMKKYFIKIEHEFDKAYNFLYVFWIYLENDTFYFLNKYINSLPISLCSDYELSENKRSVYSTDKILDLLNSILPYPHFIKDALSLSIEYIRKMPEKTQYLIDVIKSRLIYDKDDGRYGYIRQRTLFDMILINDRLSLFIFFGIIDLFMEDEFHITRNGRNMTINFYKYELPNNSTIQNIRRKIWEFVDSIFSLYPDRCFKILENYGSNRIRRNKDLALFDVSFIISLINNYFDEKSLIHGIYVHHQIKNWIKQEINLPEFDGLKIKFNSIIYDMYTNLTIDYFHEDYEKMTHDKYIEFKRNILKSKFVLSNEDNINEFVERYFYIHDQIEKNQTLNGSLDIIINENANINFTFGCSIIIEIMKRNNEIDFIPYELFASHLKDMEKSSYIWSIISAYNFKHKSRWELSYFYNLEENLVNEEQVSLLKCTFKNLAGYIDISLVSLEKYYKLNQNLSHFILESIVNSNGYDNKIVIFANDFLQYFDRFQDIDLVKQYYFQSVKIDSSYDYDKEILRRIIKIDISFLYVYIEYFYLKGDRKYSVGINKLGFIWEIEKAEIEIGKAFDFITDNAEYYSFSDESINDFFYLDNNDESKIKAKAFLFDYSDKNKNDIVKINLVVDIFNHSMREYLHDFLLYFLTLNQNVDFFSKIYWRGLITSSVGDVIDGEIEGSDWRSILSTIEKSGLGLELIPIKKYVNEQIEMCARRAENSKRERFLYNY